MREMQAATTTAPFSEQLQVNEMTATLKSWLLVSGASSGIGEESAHQYAAQGHSLILVGRRLDRLQTLAEALRQQYRIDVVVVRSISQMLMQLSSCVSAAARREPDEGQK